MRVWALPRCCNLKFHCVANTSGRCRSIFCKSAGETWFSSKSNCQIFFCGKTARGSASFGKSSGSFFKKSAAEISFWKPISTSPAILSSAGICPTSGLANFKIRKKSRILTLRNCCLNFQKFRGEDIGWASGVFCFWMARIFLAKRKRGDLIFTPFPLPLSNNRHIARKREVFRIHKLDIGVPSEHSKHHFASIHTVPAKIGVVGREVEFFKN